MKVTILSDNLKAALAVAGRSVGTDRTLPTVGHILLEATPDGGLTLTGDDRRIRSWTTADADVEQAGAVCLKKDALDGFLDSIPGMGDVSLTADPTGRAVLTCGPTVVRMAGIAADNFPAAPGLDNVLAEVSISSSTFAALVASSAFAADLKPDSNPTRECVHLAAQDGLLRFEATDGLRVARRVLALDGVPDLDVLVPAPALINAARIIGTGDLERLAVTPTHLILNTWTAHVAIMRGEGQFPDVDRIMPKESDSRVTVERTVLLRALKLVRTLEKTAVGYRVDLEITPESMVLSASDRSSDHEARTEIAIDLDGEPVALALTATHLAQALGAMDEHERVVLAFQGSDRPALVYGAADEARGHVGVLMPILAARPKP